MRQDGLGEMAVSLTPAYKDIDRLTRTVLNGDLKTGLLQFDQKASISSTTADGLSYTLTAVKNPASGLTTSVTAIKNVNSYRLMGMMSSTGSITGMISAPNLAPGVLLTGQVSYPNPSATSMVDVEYHRDNVCLQGTLSAVSTSKQTADVSLTCRYDRFLLGVLASGDGRGTFNSWSSAISYDHKKTHFTAETKNGTDLSLSYLHMLDEATTMATSLQVPLAANGNSSRNISVEAAYYKKLANGAGIRGKMDHQGTLSFMYSQQVQPDVTLTLTAQTSAQDIARIPRIGFAIDLI